MKVCFVGAGSIGKRHIKNFACVCQENEQEFEIHLYRTSNKKLGDDVEKYVKKTILTYEELDEFYDAVFITNPTHKHYDTIISFYNKTNYFFVEKPVFDTTENDIASLLGLQKHYYVACPLRYTNVLLEAKKILDNEKVLSARAISSSYLPNWRLGVDYRETYSAHKEQGGGVRIDLIHEWDYLISLFGNPQSIYSLSGKYSDLEIDSEDLAIYIAKYDDKLVELHLDYFGRKTRRSLEVRTNDHEYIFDIAGTKIFCDGSLIKTYNEDANEKYMNEMSFFYDMICGKKKTTNDLKTAVETMKIANERL